MGLLIATVGDFRKRSVKVEWPILVCPGRHSHVSSLFAPDSGSLFQLLSVSICASRKRSVKVEWPILVCPGRHSHVSSLFAPDSGSLFQLLSVSICASRLLFFTDSAVGERILIRRLVRAVGSAKVQIFMVCECHMKAAIRIGGSAKNDYRGGYASRLL
ncbi:hypothetical protein Tcan_03032 [Toxocara canis]|uniref:Uncharacterized protein n=1 Tax=Toxocara canis TaxID=6265 RepID=A0A0B2UWC9_TOXCA|nr:hypothetical protein Tcan_03032 [Toxocara canis]